MYAAAIDGPHCVLRELQPADEDLGWVCRRTGSGLVSHVEEGTDHRMID